MSVKSLSLEHVYSNLYKQILLAESYTEFPGLSFIIKACRLKPLEYTKKRTNNIVLYRHWVDEFGNSLKIIKNKRIRISYNDLSIKKDQTPCTDLYYGLALDKVASISRLALICCGIEEDYYKPCYVIAFLGIDGYLRCYMHLYGEWEQVSPLHLGMNNLKLIASKLDIKYYLKFNNTKNMPIPCTKSEQWLTILPASKDLVNVLNKDHEMIVSIIKER